MKKYNNIIWDWNGTIIDDVNASLLAVNDFLDFKNLPHINIEQYYSYVDTPIIKFYEHLFDVNTVDFNFLAKFFDEAYDKYLDKKPIMKNTDVVLKRFKSSGKNQLIISAAYKEKVVKLSKEYDVYSFFTDIVAREDYVAGDKIEIADKYVKKSGLEPAETIVIGDTLHDYDMAKSIGCDCILTTKGHQGRTILSKTDAYVIDDMLEILDIVK